MRQIYASKRSAKCLNSVVFYTFCYLFENEYKRIQEPS